MELQLVDLRLILARRLLSWLEQQRLAPASSRGASFIRAFSSSSVSSAGTGPPRAQLAEADAAAHANKDNWMSGVLSALRRLEDFSMLEVFRDGNTIEVWSISSINNQRTMRYRYLLTVPPFLQGYSSIYRHGDPRDLAEVLDQDCKEVI